MKDSVINPLLDNSKAQKSLGQLQLMDLLPTPEVQARLKRTWAIIVSRAVTTHLNEFLNMVNMILHDTTNQKFAIKRVMIKGQTR